MHDVSLALIFHYFSQTAKFTSEIMIYARLTTHGRISALIPAPRRLFCHDWPIRWPDQSKSLPYRWYRPADTCTCWTLDRKTGQILSYSLLSSSHMNNIKLHYLFYRICIKFVYNLYKICVILKKTHYSCFNIILAVVPLILTRVYTLKRWK